MTLHWDAMLNSACLFAGTVMIIGSLVLANRFFARPVDMQPVRAQTRVRRGRHMANFRR